MEEFLIAYGKIKILFTNFQVVVTPTRVKNARRKNAAREPTIVALAPFSAKSVVTFEDIPVTKTARRFLNITNPCDEDLEVREFRTGCIH